MSFGLLWDVGCRAGGRTDAGGNGQIYLRLRRVQNAAVSTPLLLFGRSCAGGAWVVRVGASARGLRWREVLELPRKPARLTLPRLIQ